MLGKLTRSLEKGHGTRSLSEDGTIRRTLPGCRCMGGVTYGMGRGGRGGCYQLAARDKMTTRSSLLILVDDLAMVCASLGYASCCESTSVGMIPIHVSCVGRSVPRDSISNQPFSSRHGSFGRRSETKRAFGNEGLAYGRVIAGDAVFESTTAAGGRRRR